MPLVYVCKINTRFKLLGRGNTDWISTKIINYIMPITEIGLDIDAIRKATGLTTEEIQRL